VVAVLRDAPTAGDGGVLDPLERRLIAAVQDGLPLEPRPYAAIARRIGARERWVRETLARWLEDGRVKRMGVVVRHRAVGYDANAMVVLDVLDAEVDAIAERLARAREVTLCYRRPRRPPRWPYNLFCMIHGRDREAVLARVATLVVEAGAAEAPRAVLFSRRCFKQRGARYVLDAHAAAGGAGGG